MKPTVTHYGKRDPIGAGPRAVGTRVVRRGLPLEIRDIAKLPAGEFERQMARIFVATQK